MTKIAIRIHTPDTVRLEMVSVRIDNDTSTIMADGKYIIKERVRYNTKPN